METKRPHERATVVLLQNREGEYCLARKKQAIHHARGEIPYSLHTYNGYGGKFEPPDKTIIDTALRELFDEAQVEGFRDKLSLVARVYFYTKKHDESFEPYMDVCFFILTDWFNRPLEGMEMGPPEWFFPGNFPYSNMMPADKFLFKEIFAGARAVYEVKLKGKGIEPEIKALEENLLDALK